jgi:Ca2+-binding RTX toxin-like protein
MLRQVTLMVTLATIAVLVVAPAAQSKTIACKSGHVCKGTFESDWIFGSSGNDRILPMSGEDYVFGNGGNDDVAHSYDADMIFGSCGSDTLRGGGGLDIIYANMPAALYTNSNCRAITESSLDSATRTAIETIKSEDAHNHPNDVEDNAHDLVDCAWLFSRDDPTPDVGFGQPRPADTVVDCSNMDDQ